MNVLLILGAVMVVAAPSLYMFLASSLPARFPLLRNKRICLLIAHPDDEAMFFAPTVLALTRPETGNHVKILCLSTGDADGLGETRKKELVKSAMTLGLRDEDDIFVVDDVQEFPDSMTTVWEEGKIANLLNSAFATNAAPRRRTSDPNQPTSNIDILITFDKNGVSSHPNHISLYHGARAFVTGLVAGKEGAISPVDMYCLTSVNVVRKYGSFSDVFTTLASWWLQGAEESPGEEEHPAALLFLNQLAGENALGTAWTAMTDAHRSQMVWFRYLWIGFSRYMVINDLRLEKVAKSGR